MIGARRDNAFRAHARRLTGADRPRCPLRGLVNYSAARVRKRERKEGRKRERRKGKREKKERKEYELTKVSSSNGMGREGIRIWRSFLYRHRAAPVFGGGGGVGSIRRVFYCPKTDRYQDYVLPSTSTLVSTIESDTKPVNRREEEGGGES